MAELNVRFDLSFGTRTLRCLMAGAMLFAAAPELASESVTLTTYYPAPSGVYAQLITTGNTYLARDSGSVGVGTTSPAYTLDVNGPIRLKGLGLYNSAGYRMLEGNASDWLRVNPDSSYADGVAAFGGWSFGTGGINIGSWYVNVPSGDLFVSGKVGIGTTAPRQSLDVNGVVLATYLVSTTNGCTETSYCITDTDPACSPHPSNCPAVGDYATATSGVIAVETLMPSYEATANIGNAPDTALMLCCPCPAGGCNAAAGIP